MPLRPRLEVELLGICAHGGLDPGELLALGLAPEGVIDFSVCCNPYGPPPAVSQALVMERLQAYPDSHCGELRQKLSDITGVSAERIVVGSGSMELIRLVALAFIRPGDPCLIPSPTFGEYATSCILLGGATIELRCPEAAQFRLSVSELAQAVALRRPRVVFLCSPNNPTGHCLDYVDLGGVVSSSPETLFVVDEAYASFAGRAGETAKLLDHDNVLVLRSMTKDYALAGLRLGYAMGPSDIIGALQKVSPPWNVNAIAQSAGVTVIERGSQHLQDSLVKIRHAMSKLTQDLVELGLDPMCSDANFFLLKVGNGRSVREWLLKRGIAVRDCASFGLPEFIRIGVRRADENDRLVAALKDWSKT